MKVFFVNETVPVLVDHVEGLLELLNLRLVKHGENIGGCTLRTLLGVLSLRSFTRHFACWWVLPLLDYRQMTSINTKYSFYIVSFVHTTEGCV